MKLISRGAASLLVLAATSGCSAFGTAPSSPTSSAASSRFSLQREQISASSPAFLPRQIGSSPIANLPRGGADGSALSSSTAINGADTALPSTLEGIISTDNWSLLSPRGRTALQNLVESDANVNAQTHVYADWPPAGTDDAGKISLTEQLADLDTSYPGGLAAYLSKARVLLKESADGTNPFSSFTASVPEGENLQYDTTTPDDQTGMTFTQAEQTGLTGIDTVAFVLVAGGLGERLGYSGIKLSLETNLVTHKSYLAMYARYIQAMQRMAHVKTGRKEVRIPLVIMTSGDTDAPTRKLLEDNDNFGFEDGQVSIVCQDKVAALKDSAAGLSLDKDSRWTVETKPHGHGDVHHLLLREGHIDKWEKEGKKHVVFLQDTNALIINSVLPALGVSIAKKFDLNSITIPRLAGEAAGAIARLE